MAFKYKLVKETETGSADDIRHFPVSNPKTLAAMGTKVDRGAVKDFLKEPANSSRSTRLESDIINSLEVAGFDQFEIEEFMDFIYLTRNRFIGGGKYGEKPLNEEKPKDPIDTKMQNLLARFKKEDEESGENIPDPKAKNTFKTDLKEKIIKRIKENKKAMLVRASQQKP